MHVLSWEAMSFYIVFKIFVFYQQLHGKHFKGESQSFATVLHIFALSGMLVGLVYLIYYGWSVVWWAPFLVLAIGLVASSFLGFVLERLVGAYNISLAGFVVWPICAVLMFMYVP